MDNTLFASLKSQKEKFNQLRKYLEDLINSGIATKEEICLIEEKLKKANEEYDSAIDIMYIKTNYAEILHTNKIRTIIIYLVLISIVTSFSAVLMLPNNILEFIGFESFIGITSLILGIRSYQKVKKNLQVAKSEKDYDLDIMEEEILSLEKNLARAKENLKNNKIEEKTITDCLSEQYITLNILLEAFLSSEDHQMESKSLNVDANIGKTIKANITADVLRRKKNGS